MNGGLFLTIAGAFTLAGLVPGCGGNSGGTAGDGTDAHDARGAQPDVGAPDGGVDGAADAVTRPATFESGACPFPVAAETAISCGTVTAPENHATRGPRTVRLAVAVVKGQPAGGSGTPLVYLAGGPGGSGLGEGITNGALTAQFSRLAAGRDFVLVDQRGTGFSMPSLACPGMKPPMSTPTPGGMMAGALSPADRAALIACHDRNVAAGVDLAQYDTAASADDLALIRQALGYARWDLLSVSYGTRLALEVMRRHPDGLRAVVLDSVLPPQVDVIAENATGIYRAMDLLFKRCEAGACGALNLTLRTTFDQTLAALAQNPVPLPGSGSTFTAEMFVTLVGRLLYQRDNDNVIVGLVTIVQQRLTSTLETLATLLENDDSIAAGLHLSVMCRDYLPFTTRDKIEAELAKIPANLRPYLGGANYLEMCALWGVPPAADAVRVPVSSPLSTLVLAGTLDPATPPTWSRLAAATLSGSAIFEFAKIAHGIFPEPCGADLVTTFLAQPTTRPPEPACLND